MTTIRIKWGVNELTFTRDSHVNGLYHSGSIAVDESVLDGNPRDVFMRLLELGLLKPSEVKF